MYSVGVNVTFDPVFYNVSEGTRQVVLRVVKRGESVVSVNVTFTTMDNSALGVIRELLDEWSIVRLSFSLGEGSSKHEYAAESYCLKIYVCVTLHES